MMGLWQSVNYTTGLSFLLNNFIREYDIEKANINVLYKYGVIDKSLYDYLYNAPRMVRQKQIGLMQRNDPSIVKVLQQGIIEAKRKLFEENNIQDHMVLAIKNDAVFIIGYKLRYTEFGNIRFVNKNVYTGFYCIDSVEYYYYYNSIDGTEKLDIKGINDEVLRLHENGMLKFIKYIFRALQHNNLSEALKSIKELYMKYILLELPCEFYRPFNSESQYHIKPSKFINTGYTVDNISQDMLSVLDISYNIHILQEIYKIIISLVL